MAKRAALASISSLVLALAACANPGQAPESARAPAAFALRDANLDVWLLDIGQGACVFVDCPDGAPPLIVDCGAKGRSVGAGDNGDATVTTGWIASRLGQHAAPPRVIVSHADTDHFSLIDDAVAADRAPEVYLGSAYTKHNEDFQDWLDQVEQHGGDLYYFPERTVSYDDEDLRCGAAISDVLIANATGGETDNADSIVLALSYEGVSFVFAGDAEGGEESTEPLALASRRQLPRLIANRIILSASHHGAHTANSNSPAWAQAWNEQRRLHAVSFSARPSTHDHPDCRVIERYEANMSEAMTPFGLSCSGEEEDLREVSRRFLSSHENGHVLIRVNASGLRIYCEVRTPACSGPIPASVEMPGRTAVAAGEAPP